jgi:branched-chain amino acid transport system substrate-binding protein
MKKIILCSLIACSAFMFFSCAEKQTVGVKKQKKIVSTTASATKSEIVYKRGVTFFGEGKYVEASSEFSRLVKNYNDSPYYNNTIYYWGLSEYKQNNLGQALSILNKVDFDRTDLDADTKIKILMLKGNILSSNSDSGKAFESYADAYTLSINDEARSKLKSSMLSEIDKIIIDDLESMEKKYSNQDFNSYIIFTLGERYIQKGNSIKAKEKFLNFQKLYPQHEYSVQVDNYLSRLKSVDLVDPYTIGVILPLTGKNSAFGQKSLTGIQLAAGIFGDNKNSKPPIKLAIMDSQSDPEVARMAAGKLMMEDHVLAIVGPLGNDEASTTASQCFMSGIPNISLSQKDDLEGLGQYVFRIAMGNRNQVRRLVGYAMDKLSMKNFGIIYPEDRYGQELTKYFWEEVLKKGGDITAIESYETGQTDFREQVKKILGVYYVGTRLKEYNDLKTQLEQDPNPKKKMKASDLTLPPVNSFDAIFIPDDAKIVSQIAPYLPFYDAKNVVLLGPNTWNSPQLINRGQNNVNGALFVDGFTSLTANPESRVFVKNFKDTFNLTPGVLEAQGYDAMNIIIAAMNKAISDKGIKGINREIFRGYIIDLGSFTGATGKMKIEKNGDIDKELFVLGVEKGKIILKD